MQLAGKQNGGRHHRLARNSLHEAEAAALLAGLRPERATLALAAPHTSRGSLLNAADIFAVASCTLVPESVIRAANLLRMRVILAVKEAWSQIWRADAAGHGYGYGFGRYGTLSFWIRRASAYIAERNTS